jgi:hypothetical protein
MGKYIIYRQEADTTVDLETVDSLNLERLEKHISEYKRANRRNATRGQVSFGIRPEGDPPHHKKRRLLVAKRASMVSGMARKGVVKDQVI